MPRFPHRALPLLLAALPLPGCEDWPLYLHLPDATQPPPEPRRITFAEDPSLPEGELQDLGEFAAPLVATGTGDLYGCGFDPTLDWPAWPDHLIDLDGDGVADETGPWFSGWYTGDVDSYGIGPLDDAWLDVSLSWDHSPDGGVNSPYRPAEPEGAWSTESDLDFVVLTVDESGASADVLSDSGFSTRHPEESGQVIPLEAGERVIVAVACHHAVPSAYALRLQLLEP